MQPNQTSNTKHQHGWECFRESGGYTNAMELHRDPALLIEQVYKTAYRTGYKNGYHDACDVLEPKSRG